MLGREITEFLTRRKTEYRLAAEVGVAPFSPQGLDIADAAQVERILTAVQPSIVINCAAYTAVDDCESNRALAFRINGQGPGILAGFVRRIGALLVHLSSDYVFDGTKDGPYVETDEPNPLSAYGESKLAGERAIFEEGAAHIIARTSWLFGPHGRCFPQRMLSLARREPELRVVSDQIGCPTYTRDLAEAIVALISVNARGVYHVTNSGVCSWFDFAKETLLVANVATPVIAVSSKEMPRPAMRPQNSVLDSTKFTRTTGLRLPAWQDALRDWWGMASHPMPSSYAAQRLLEHESH